MSKESIYNILKEYEQKHLDGKSVIGQLEDFSRADSVTRDEIIDQIRGEISERSYVEYWEGGAVKTKSEKQKEFDKAVLDAVARDFEIDNKLTDSINDLLTEISPDKSFYKTTPVASLIERLMEFSPEEVKLLLSDKGKGLRKDFIDNNAKSFQSFSMQDNLNKLHILVSEAWEKTLTSQDATIIMSRSFANELISSVQESSGKKVPHLAQDSMLGHKIVRRLGEDLVRAIFNDKEMRKELIDALKVKGFDNGKQNNEAVVKVLEDISKKYSKETKVDRSLGKHAQKRSDSKASGLSSSQVR
jgi:hypothetical protein